MPPRQPPPVMGERVASLESQRESDSRALVELERRVADFERRTEENFTQIKKQLDVLILRNERTDARSAMIERISRGFMPALWLGIIGVIGWIVQNFWWGKR